MAPVTNLHIGSLSVDEIRELASDQLIEILRSCAVLYDKLYTMNELLKEIPTQRLGVIHTCNEDIDM